MNDFLANSRALHIHRWRWWWWWWFKVGRERITERRWWDWVKVLRKMMGRASERLKLWEINGWDARCIQGSFFRLSLLLPVFFWLPLSFIQLFLFAWCVCVLCSNSNFVRSYPHWRGERKSKTIFENLIEMASNWGDNVQKVETLVHPPHQAGELFTTNNIIVIGAISVWFIQFIVFKLRTIVVHPIIAAFVFARVWQNSKFCSCVMVEHNRIS